MNALPKLRKGLTYTFSDYDYDGKPQWLLHDAGRNKFFIIGWPDYEMLMRWHLSDPEDLIYAVNNETTLNVDMHDLENLISFLAYNFLLEMPSKAISKTAYDQGLFKDDNIISWLITHYLFFRIPLWHPDPFLTRTKKFGDFLFNKYLLYTMIVLGVIAVFQITQRWDDFIGTFPSIISWRGLFFYFISFTLVKIMHEAGHAYKCKKYNIPVPNCGLAFLVFWPVLYTDTTLSWTLNSKKRLQIALAGIQVETYITIIAALIWCNTSNLTLQTICYVTITVNWLSSLLINVSPFMRFDGYYILSDFLKMPNLQFRSFALARWQLRKVLFGWNDPPPEKLSRRMHNILIVYAYLTWIYRLILYIGIAVLVYFLFFKALGIILFLIEIHYFILDPFIREFKLWYLSKEKFSLNINTAITMICVAVLVGIFFIPFSEAVELPATMHYAHQFIFAPENGIIVKPLPPTGSTIIANEPIVILDSPDLNNAIKQLKLEYEMLQNEMRRASIDERFSDDKNSILFNLRKKKSEYDRLIELQKKLTITTSFNGVLVDAATELHKGSYITKDSWLGDVINTHLVQVEAYVGQRDIGLLSPGQTGFFYPEDISAATVKVKLVLIEPVNPTSLNCQYLTKSSSQQAHRQIVDTPCYNASEYGGQIPTYITDKGEYVPVDSVHRVLFTTDQKITIKNIQRGSVYVKTRAHSYAYRFFYEVKRILVQEKYF